MDVSVGSRRDIQKQRTIVLQGTPGIEHATRKNDRELIERMKRTYRVLCTHQPIDYTVHLKAEPILLFLVVSSWLLTRF